MVLKLQEKGKQESVKMERGVFTPAFFLLTLSLTCAVRIIVKECPITETAWKARSQVFTCTSPLVYHCIPDDEGNLMETCLEPYRVDPSSEGGCPWAAYFTNGESILGSTFHTCKGIRCPQKNDPDYWTNELYIYPVCLNNRLMEVTYTTISQSAVITTATSNDGNEMGGDKVPTVIIAVTLVAVVVLITVVTICIWCKRKSNSNSAPGTNIESHPDNSRIPLFIADKCSIACVPRERSADTLTIFRKACLEGNTSMVKSLIGDFEDLLYTKYDKSFTSIHFAGFSGSVELVRYLVDKGVDINSKDNTGRTIAHIACRAGHTGLVDYLIGLDEDILNIKDINGETPLYCKDNDGRTIMHHACKRAQSDLVKSLLRKQKDAYELKDNKGCTPFHFAGFSGSVELVQYLIDKGCDVNSKDNAGRTIVHNACHEGHIDLVKFVIGKYKCAFSKKEENSGSTAFHCENNDCQTTENSMVENTHSDLEKHMTKNEKCTYNIKDKKGITPFHLTGFSGSVALVQYLIEKGCDINEKDIAGRTITHNACQAGNVDLVMFLTEGNKDSLVVKESNGVTPLYFKDKDGRTIVHHACEKANLHLVKRLIGLDKCAFDVKDNNGSTPVTLTGFSGSVELVKYLIDEGCDVKSKDNTGRTIVHNACQAGHITLVKYLIELDKDFLNIKDMNDVVPFYCKYKEGRTIVHRACEKADLDLVKRLVVKDRGVLDVKDINGCTPFHYAGFSGSEKLVKYLIDKGCDVNGKDSTCRTIVHYACQAGHIQLVKYLIKHDKNTLNIKDANGITPLHIKDKNGRTIIHHACKKGHLALIKLLTDIENGAFNVKDKNGCTPLHLAGFSGSVDVAKFLIDKGCDVFSKDTFGRTIAHIASEARNDDLILFLIKINKDMIIIKDNNGMTPLDHRHKGGQSSVPRRSIS